MENKIKQIQQILNEETITNCRTILQIIESKLNEIEYEERQKMTFKI